MPLPVTKAIIIDDEPNAVSNLTNLIQRYCPSIHVAASAAGVDSAVLLIEHHLPDVIFLDISMPRKSGFELLNMIAHRPAVVFVTAHEQYAVKAIKACAVDYLLKPIDINDLKLVEEKLLQLRSLFQNVELKKNYDASVGNLSNMLRTPGIIRTITVSGNEGYKIIDVTKIIYLEGKDNYTVIQLESGSRITATRTLKDFEGMLKEAGFLRIHKSSIINLASLRKVIKKDIVTVEMSDGSILEASRRRTPELIEKTRLAR